MSGKKTLAHSKPSLSKSQNGAASVSHSKFGSTPTSIASLVSVATAKSQTNVALLTNSKPSVACSLSLATAKGQTAAALFGNSKTGTTPANGVSLSLTIAKSQTNVAPLHNPKAGTTLAKAPTLTSAGKPALSIPKTRVVKPLPVDGQRLAFETQHVSLWTECFKSLGEIHDDDTITVVFLPTEMFVTVVQPHLNRIVTNEWRAKFLESYAVRAPGIKFGINLKLLNDAQNQLSGGGQKGKCMGWRDVPADPTVLNDVDKLHIHGLSEENKTIDLTLAISPCSSESQLGLSLSQYQVYPFTFEVPTSWIHNTLKHLDKLLRRLNQGDVVKIQFNGATKAMSIGTTIESLKSDKKMTIDPTHIIPNPFRPVSTTQDSHAVFLPSPNSLTSFRTWDEFKKHQKKPPRDAVAAAAAVSTLDSFRYEGIFACRVVLQAVKRKKLGTYVRLYMQQGEPLRIDFLFDQNDADPGTGSGYKTCLIPLTVAQQQQRQQSVLPLSHPAAKLSSSKPTGIATTLSETERSKPPRLNRKRTSPVLEEKQVPLQPTTTTTMVTKRKRDTSVMSADALKSEEAKRAAKQLEKERKECERKERKEVRDKLERERKAKRDQLEHEKQQRKEQAAVRAAEKARRDVERQKALQLKASARKEREEKRLVKQAQLVLKRKLAAEKRATLAADVAPSLPRAKRAKLVKFDESQLPLGSVEPEQQIPPQHVPVISRLTPQEIEHCEQISADLQMFDFAPTPGLT